jgi:hypothetical protein
MTVNSVRSPSLALGAPTRGYGGPARPAPCRSRRIDVVLAALVTWAVLSAAGCRQQTDRPPLGRVRGTVTLNGAPLPRALIVFHPPKGHLSCDTTDADGHYDLLFIREDRGAIVGKHRVQIRTQPPENASKEIVPACYNSQTTLEREVVQGDNEIRFELKSAKTKF